MTDFLSKIGTDLWKPEMICIAVFIQSIYNYIIKFTHFSDLPLTNSSTLPSLFDKMSNRQEFWTFLVTRGTRFPISSYRSVLRSLNKTTRSRFRLKGTKIIGTSFFWIRSFPSLDGNNGISKDNILTPVFLGAFVSSHFARKQCGVMPTRIVEAKDFGRQNGRCVFQWQCSHNRVVWGIIQWRGRCGKV